MVKLQPEDEKFEKSNPVQGYRLSMVKLQHTAERASRYVFTRYRLSMVKLQLVSVEDAKTAA